MCFSMPAAERARARALRGWMIWSRSGSNVPPLMLRRGKTRCEGGPWGEGKGARRRGEALVHGLRRVAVRLADLEAAPFEVHVAPAQRGELAEPEPGVQRGREERPPQRIGVLEQAPGLLAREVFDLFGALDLPQAARPGDVLRAQLALDRGLEHDRDRGEHPVARRPRAAGGAHAREHGPDVAGVDLVEPLRADVRLDPLRQHREGLELLVGPWRCGRISSATTTANVPIVGRVAAARTASPARPWAAVRSPWSRRCCARCFTSGPCHRARSPGPSGARRPTPAGPARPSAAGEQARRIDVAFARRRWVLLHLPLRVPSKRS